MIPASFEYFSPRSLREAVDLLSSHVEDVKILAGGQSLVPLMKLRLAKPGYIVDLSRIRELNYIREEGDRIAIGSLTTHAEIEESELLKRRCPLLPQTAATIGDVQVRNQGTIGGSLAHADPAGDMPAAILALGAEMKAIGPSGERSIKAEDFFIGLLTSALEPNEILTEVRVPVLEKTKTAYLKAAQKASGFAVVGIAVCLRLDQGRTCGDIAIGVTGVADRPYRAEDVEKILRGKKLEEKLIEEAANKVVKGQDVIEDINGSKDYRSHLATVYAARAIRTALEA
ncbi:MAG: xanthine dehydrogenase family protein subunit M [Deltaproteobacteria bacterium]|nr:xanthine dehydrogenase family protein subunit M [Deltaproteobacteria bacterium]